MIIFKRKKYDKKTLEELKELLEKEKEEFQKKVEELNLKEKDMAIKMPDFMASEDASIEADEVEELNNLLSLKMEWENEIDRINQALERMEKGTYGICVECGNLIELERLKIEPTAQICIACVKKKNRQLS